MVEKQEVRVGDQILSEDDLEFTVQYNGELFTLKYPSPFEKAQIEATIARMLGGYSRSSYPPDHLTMTEATAYVDAIVVKKKSPDWFKSAWTCYDETCILALYEGYLQFRNEFQERTAQNRPKGGGTGG